MSPTILTKLIFLKIIAMLIPYSHMLGWKIHFVKTAKDDGLKKEEKSIVIVN